jgi:hypothetical protein
VRVSVTTPFSSVRAIWESSVVSAPPVLLVAFMLPAFMFEAFMFEAFEFVMFELSPPAQADSAASASAHEAVNKILRTLLFLQAIQNRPLI